MVRTGFKAWAARLLPIVLLSGLLAGCRAESVSTPPGATLVSLSLTPANPSIAPGTTIQLTATGSFSDGSSRNLSASVTWSSSDTAIASVSDAAGSKGLASAGPGAGSAVIQAVSGGISGSTTLSATPVDTIDVTPAMAPAIAPGTTFQFEATGTLADRATQNLTSFATWTSSNSSIVTVSDATGSKGLATAASVGSANIIASYSTVSGLASFTSSSLQSIFVTPASASNAAGTTRQFIATGTLGDNSTQVLTIFATWTSSNPAVATISNAPGSRGLSTAVSQGTTSIAAAFSSVTTTAPATLTVTQAVLQSLTIAPTNPSIALGRTRQFAASGTFTGGSTQDVTDTVIWSSANPAVATISNEPGFKGLATSERAGSTVIRAASGNVSATTVLSVTPAVLESIQVTPALASLAAGFSLQYTATGIFTDGSTQDLTTTVTWTSSVPSIALISDIAGSKGLATATFNPGTTAITAAFSGITSNEATLTVTP